MRLCESRDRRQIRLPLTSKMRTFRLSRGMVIRLCCCETESLLIVDSIEMVISGERMFFN